MNKFIIPEGVSLKVTYSDVRTGLMNDPAFYVVGDANTVAVVSVGDKDVYSVLCVGEMRIDTEEGEVLRYTSDLFDKGIITDQELWEAFDAECWSNNAWFEIFDETDNDTTGDIFHDVSEAIQNALDLAGDLTSRLVDATVTVPSERK